MPLAAAGRHRRARTSYDNTAAPLAASKASGQRARTRTHKQLTLRHDTPPLLPRHIPPGPPRARLRLQTIDDVLLLLAHGVHRGGVVPFLLRPDLALEPLRGRRLLAVARSVGLEDGVPLYRIAIPIMPRVPGLAVDAGAAAGVGVRRRRRFPDRRGALGQGRRGVADLRVVPVWKSKFYGAFASRWRCRFVTTRRSQHSRVIAVK